MFNQFSLNCTLIYLLWNFLIGKMTINLKIHFAAIIDLENTKKLSRVLLEFVSLFKNVWEDITASRRLFKIKYIQIVKMFKTILKTTYLCNFLWKIFGTVFLYGVIFCKIECLLIQQLIYRSFQFKRYQTFMVTFLVTGPIKICRIQGPVTF